MDKLQMIFNIDVEPICQNKWNICLNKKILQIQENQTN